METNAWNVAPDQAAEARKRAEKIGMKLHSVLFGWANFNQEESAARDIANVEKALHAAKAYGGSALLVVPCRTGVTPMPEAWEFDIEFDEKTGHVERVVAGDNAKYAKYIEAQNHAVDTSREAVRKLIPTAEKAGVILALENVWNNLWVKPAYYANFVKSFDNPWVGSYFDIGNHVKYAAAGRVDPGPRKDDRQVPREGLQTQRQRAWRHVRSSPRRQHPLASRPPGDRRDRIQRVPQHRGRRPAVPQFNRRLDLIIAGE